MHTDAHAVYPEHRRLPPCGGRPAERHPHEDRRRARRPGGLDRTREREAPGRARRFGEVPPESAPPAPVATTRGALMLVDTSIWVDHLRHHDALLSTLLAREGVECHPFIVGELGCGQLERREEILSLLSRLPQVP